MSDGRPILEDIYFCEDAGEIRFGNSQVELSFSKHSGSWVGLKSRVCHIEIFRQDEETPTELITVDGESKRVNRQPFYVVVNAATLGFNSKYNHYALRLINDKMAELTISLRDETDDWRLNTTYILRPRDATVQRRLEVAYVGEDVRLLRNVQFITPGVTVGEPSNCLFETPGCSIKPHYPLQKLPENKMLAFGFAPHQRPGILAIYNPVENCAFMCWPSSENEPSIPYIRRADGRITVMLRVLAADRFRKGHTLACGSQFIRVHRGSWKSALRYFQRWYDVVGLKSPRDAPGWAENARIYEIAVCDPERLPSSLHGIFPYLSFEAVIDDLPRIRELGFNIIQLIPYHPYPDYAVEDYYSIDKTYGPREEVKRMIEKSHELGMKVILDLVIHGCVDRSIIKVWRRFRGENVHIEDHEETVWLGGSPIPHINPLPEPYRPGGEKYIEWLGESPIIKDHPEWFMRTEDGEVASTHTFAFDHANEDWQKYVVDVMKFYIQELDVDGFRIDWPDWNFFPNWDANIHRHASSSLGGAVRMLERARRELKTIKPDIIFYIESTGPLYHKVADFTYNYDEHWLFAALASLTSERITAREVAEWLEERNLAFPEGSMKVHHIYSSNTHYWWRLTRKLGSPIYKALFALCAFIEGAIMNFAGGESGSEGFFRKILRIRCEIPALSRGECKYKAVNCSDEMIFAVLRSYKGSHVVPIVSFNPSWSRFTLSLPVEEMGINPGSTCTVYDGFNNRVLEGKDGKTLLSGKELGNLELRMAPYGVAVLLINKIKN